MARKNLWQRLTPYYIPRMFITQDARLNAFENGRVFQVNANGSSNGNDYQNSLESLQAPVGFDFAVQPELVAVPAPNELANPLLTPALALSFAENLSGH